MRVIALDTETTGLGDDAKVCEIAVVELSQSHDFAPTKMWCTRIDPEMPICPAASAVHHITDEDVVFSPTFSEWLEVTNNEPFEGGIVYVVGHNVQFDLGKLQGCFEGDVRIVDTLRLAKRFLGGSSNFKLGTLLYAHGIEANKNAHSALDDTFAAVRLLNHIRAISEAKTIHQLHEWSIAPLYIQEMPFGKHKGQSLKSLPANYVNWLLNLDDLDPDIRWSLNCKESPT